MASVASLEIALPLEALLRLAHAGPSAADELALLARRGDWRTRALAVSALGRVVREDPSAWRRDLLRHRIAPRAGWLRRRWPSVGPRGSLVRNHLVNALQDATWIVRCAAALALGECRSRDAVEPLRAALADRFRPVRVAAAATLARCGAPAATPSLLEGTEPTPARIGDTASSLEWLARLAAGHAEVLGGWADLGESGARARSPQEWASVLAGAVREDPTDAREAEVRRYAQEKELHYNFTKPFSPVSREQNVRSLHSFLVVAEALRAPLGGLILDLGGGAAWVSDLLAKFGFRPVTLDLALPLLRVGRDRFAREHQAFRPVAADMTALPFSAASVDAVVVIDALHHVPDVPAVFREAFRVLGPGGQFLLAEPGEGHGEADASVSERASHGICEREVHLAEAVLYGRAAGFDDVRIVPHFVPRVTFTPEAFQAAVTSPTERWRVLEAGAPRSFDAVVLQSVFNHPILAFQKGLRPLDSRAPRLLRASISPDLRRDGARLHGRVRVVNDGDTRWLKGGGEPGRVRLGLQLLTPERGLIHLDFARAELAADVPAGGDAALAVDVALPDAAAPYVVKLDMVDEHICWFEDQGSPPVWLSV